MGQSHVIIRELNMALSKEAICDWRLDLTISGGSCMAVSKI